MNEHFVTCTVTSLHKLALCDRIGYSLVDRRIQNLLIIAFIHLNIWETYLG